MSHRTNWLWDQCDVGPWVVVQMGCRTAGLKSKQWTSRINILSKANGKCILHPSVQLTYSDILESKFKLIKHAELNVTQCKVDIIINLLWDSITLWLCSIKK